MNSLCVLALLGCFIKVFYVFSGEIHHVNSWYSTYVSLSTVYLILCLYGLFLRLKWGFWGFSLFLLIHPTVQWWVGRWDISAFALFLAIELTAIFQYRRME